MRNERRMTDVEALMWNLEKDPHLSSSIANVTLLDQAPDPERLRARLQRASVCRGLPIRRGARAARGLPPGRGEGMYMLTGNYKTDQVHVPDLLERLGQ